MEKITKKLAAGLLPQLSADANKYTRGTCELVVGQPSYPGAGVLATMAATRMGAGYVCAYTCSEAAAALRVVQPSCVCWPFDTFAECDHPSSSRHPRAVVVGSGFATGEASTDIVVDVLRHAQEPALVDGGGLAALATAEAAAVLRERFVAGYPTVITPHGGEAVRLLSTFDTADVQSARAHAKKQGVPEAAADALFIAQAFGVICVLKGPDTYIADGNEKSADDVMVLTCGTPALAKAGTGDVLAGTIGSLLAHGMDPKDACALGAFVHARAGVLAAADSVELCVTTEDVLAHLPHAVRTLDGKL